MFEPLNIARMAEALATYAGDRLGVIAQNIAQADTPGYKAQDLPSFADVYSAQSGADSFAMRATLPGHIRDVSAGPTPHPTPSGGEASVNGNTVTIEKQMVKMADIRQSHEMALSVYRVTQDITLAALGKK